MPAPPDTAAFLLDHRLSLEPVDNIPDALYPGSQAAAYAVQDEVVRGLTGRFGGVPCGYKMACTNERVIRLLNVSGPFPGRLMTHSTHDSDVELDPGAFRLRIMEAEFGFILGEDVPQAGAPYTAETIRPYIEAFVPSLEIVDHRFNDFSTVGEYALIADNAVHGACIFGEPVTGWQGVDFCRRQVRLQVNGETFAVGVGENVLGDPLYAMAWLANHLALRDRTLRAGERVSTGTAGEIYFAEPGDAVLADYGNLGRVGVRFRPSRSTTTPQA
ncbi:MAG: hypothetical protein F4Z52_04025 [Gammaproteobacteria bacterium]|nr:hypothetical protein [Gammaproteobacteria bacterium]MXY64273.1 hypothetical protein [Gammaproteobacteria bacterium]MYG67081.1 hypothetical protein [Gammaproteobacteria bacterium]